MLKSPPTIKGREDKIEGKLFHHTVFSCSLAGAYMFLTKKDKEGEDTVISITR